MLNTRRRVATPGRPAPHNGETSSKEKHNDRHESPPPPLVAAGHPVPLGQGTWARPCWKVTPQHHNQQQTEEIMIGAIIITLMRGMR